MHAPQPLSPIRILPAQLADQIAAGEVIERPASVLKELIENSLDAGCTRLDVELLHGGIESIRVTDDGYGITRGELPLAISRHATSKITRLEDLLQLHSLGFRGEALASICSVSQWEITSRRTGEESAYTLRHEQAREPMPVNHAVGTSVWIRNLFFNTPARRKFLRAERTEFRHCDELFRRLALARFAVAFYLKHNGRLVHRLPAVNDDIGRSRRVQMLCGEAFVRHSLALDFPHANMRLWGWISKPEYSRQQSDLQYFYINGRIIRDRVINHALRLAYQTLLPAGRYAAYVLHLELDPASVDVNVHPTKHEVRFREARQIHDFLIRCVREALRHPLQTVDWRTTATIQEAAEAYGVIPDVSAQPVASELRNKMFADTFFGSVQTVLFNRFLLTQSATGFYLIDVSRAQALRNSRRWREACAAGEIKSRPVLFPVKLDLTAQQMQSYQQQHARLVQLGFEISHAGPAQVLLRAIPVWLQGFDSERLLRELLTQDWQHNDIFERIEYSLLSQQFDIARVDIRSFLHGLAQDDGDLSSCWRELTQSDLAEWLLAQQAQHE